MASIRWLKNRRRWIVRYHVTVVRGVNIGRVFKGSKTFRHKEAALAFKSVVESKADYWAAGLGVTCTTIDNGVAQWLAAIRDYTSRTRHLYKLVLGCFARELPAHIRFVSDLKPEHVRWYIQNLLDRNRKARTANVHLTAIKSFCRWASENYDIANPAARVKMLKEDPPNNRFLTEDEYKKSLAVGDDEYKTWATFIANTGLRATEFCQATWQDITPVMDSIYVRGKGRRVRFVPLNDTCREILQKLKANKSDNCNHIFLSKNTKKPLSRRALLDRCNKAAKAAGVPKFGPHSLRHFFATRLVRQKNANLSCVAAVLGHSSTRTTEIYLHILPQHLQGLTEGLS